MSVKQSGVTQQSKKRHRATVVCGNCRRKKTKCDLGTPCSKCVKSQMSNSCSYTEFTMPGVGDNGAYAQINMKLQEEVDTLKNKLSELEASIAVASMRTGSFPSNSGGQLPSEIYESNKTISNTNSNTNKNSNSNISIINDNKKDNNNNNKTNANTSHIKSKIAHGNLNNRNQIVNNTNSHIGRTGDSLTKFTSNFAGFFDPIKLELEFTPHGSNISSLLPAGATINFYLEFFNLSSFPGKLNRPLPMLSLSRGDPGVQLLLSYKDQLIRRMSSSITRYSAFEAKELSAPASSIRGKLSGWLPFLKQENLLSGAQSLARLAWTAESNLLNHDIRKLNDYGKLIGVLRQSVGGEHDQRPLNEQLLLVLPKQKVFWILIKRFFKYWYPIVPVLDEHSFRNELHQLLGPEVEGNEGPFLSVKLITKQDWVFLGMVLIVCRLSYLTIFHPSVAQNESILYGNGTLEENEKYSEIKYLMENGVPVDAIVVAEECLREVDITKRPQLGTFQAYYLLRIYRSLAPEEGDKSFGGDSELLDGILLHMAYSLNLDRDPDMLDYHFDKRTKNLRRKLWQSLVINDFIDLIICGNTYSSRINNFDTKLPEYSPETSNIYDQDLEQEVIQGFYRFSKVRNASAKVFSMILKMGHTPLEEFLKESDKLEEIVKQELGEIQDVLDQLNLDFNFSNLHLLYTSLHMFLVLCTIYYGLLLYFEKENNHIMSLYYFRKLFILAISQTLEVAFKLLNKDGSSCLSDGTYIIFAPILLAINHNFCLVWASLVVRLISTKRDFLYTKNMRNLSNNDKLKLENIEGLIEIFLHSRPRDAAVTSILANSFYIGWKMKRIHFFAHKLLIGDEIYQFDDARTRQTVMNYTNEQLHDLLIYFKENKEKTEKIEKAWKQEDIEILDKENENKNFGGYMSKIFGDASTVAGEDARSDAFWIQLLTQSQSVSGNDQKYKLTLRLQEGPGSSVMGGGPIHDGSGHDVTSGLLDNNNNNNTNNNNTNSSHGEGNYFNTPATNGIFGGLSQLRGQQVNVNANANANLLPVQDSLGGIGMMAGPTNPILNAENSNGSINELGTSISTPFDLQAVTPYYDGLLNDPTLDDLTLYWNQR